MSAVTPDAGVSHLAPTLTIRAGLVGHRFTAKARLPQARAANLQALLHGLFQALATEAAALRQRHDTVYAPAAPALRLVSSLASGADLIVQQALPEGWQSEIVLPMPAARFRLDYPETANADEPHTRALFDAELERLSARDGTRILTLPDPGDDPVPGYVAAAAMILANCDLLVAVWDGAEQDRDDCDGRPAAALRPAGTAWTMREAVRRGIPTIWLDLASGKARFVAASSEPSRLFAVAEVDCSAGPLGERLEAILAPPSGADGPGHHGDLPARLHDALNEQELTRNVSVAYDMMVRLMTLRRPRLRIPLQPVAERSAEWDGYLAGSPQAGTPLAGSLKTVLLPRFAMFDTLAQAYGHSYRSTYVLAFLLSAAAVFVGLLSILDWPHIMGWHLLETDKKVVEVDTKGVAAFAEFVLLFAIIWLVRDGQRRQSHQRWLDYRALAESLRHLRFLSMIGASGAATQGAHGGAGSWQLWYTRATIREIGLPSGLLSAEHNWQLLRQVREHDLAGQADYHHANHANLHKVHEHLHGIGNWLFVGTAGILFVLYVLPWFGYLLGQHVIPWVRSFFDPEAVLAAPMCIADSSGKMNCRVFNWMATIKPSITLLSAFLPALGAALAGIRVQGDFEGFALRSEKTAAAIESLMGDVATEQLQPDLAGTTQVLQSCARVMSDDLEAWEALYGRKALVLPA